MIKQTPLLFTDILAQKLFDGRKTTTLRLQGLQEVNSYPIKRYWGTVADSELMRRLRDMKELSARNYDHWLVNPEQWHHFFVCKEGGRGKEIVVKCPYGVKGDLIWVKEPYVHDEPGCNDPKCGLNHYVYRGAADKHYRESTKWNSSLYMPKHISRTTLKLLQVTAVPVSYLDERNLVSEGLTPSTIQHITGKTVIGGKESFKVVLNHLYRDGFYEADPIMWCLRFDALRKNVGEIIE